MLATDQAMSRKLMDPMERVKKVYRKREASEKRLWDDKTWNTLNPSVNFIEYHFSKEFFIELKKAGLTPDNLSQKRILDLGCGWGKYLRLLVENGADPKRVYGMDIMDHHLKVAMEKNPAVRYVRADSRFSPFKDEMFDVILIFTVFSAVIDPESIEQIAREALRMLNTDGVIIVYDVGRPSYEWKHKDEQFGDLLGLKGIKPSFVKHCFQSGHIHIRKILINPKIIKTLELGLFKAFSLLFRSQKMSMKNKLGLLSNLRALDLKSYPNSVFSSSAEVLANGFMALRCFKIHYIASIRKCGLDV